MRSDIYETIYWTTNPNTGEDEVWALRIEYILHSAQPALLSRSEGSIEVPKEPAYAEILSIKESSGLDIEQAMTHWNQQDFIRVNDELQCYVRDPFIYERSI